MTEYEQAICFTAMVLPRVYVWSDGSYTVRYSEGVSWLPAAVFNPYFPEIIEAGLMERVETYPTDMYYPNDACREKAFELWAREGWKPYYPVPGVVAAKKGN